jgi:hypothetical protein
MHRLIVSVFAAFLLVAPGAVADVADERVTILLKFLPEPGLEADGKLRFVAESCRACVQRHDPAFERFNTRESVLQIEVPKARSLELAFEIAPRQSQRVIINDTDLSVRRDRSKLLVALPPLYEDAIWAPALETDIVEPGMVLRIEHADLARRAGAYAEGRFPELERRAADNLSFAMREVIRRMDLGQRVAQEKTGLIMVMGFDTNFPAGHTDAPPHVHMHLRWPNNVGSQIAHYYLDERGLLTENKVGIRALDVPQLRFGPGERFATTDNRGQQVYAHTITSEGFLLIDRPSDGASCLLSPKGAGFQDGVGLDCGPLGAVDIAVTNDFAEGLIVVRTGEIEERFRYDTGTGKLLTPNESPPAPASARNPVY